MKKRWTLFLALLLIFALCACKDKTEADTTPEPEPTETVAPTETPEPAKTELGSGSFESFSASFVGAEKFTAADGGDALRVYFDFTNRSEESVSAIELLLYSAVQDGKTLNWAESAEPLEEDGNLSLRLQPGHKIRCVLQYALVSNSTVAVSLEDSQNHSVSALLPLDQLPGAPEPLESEQTQTQTQETTLPQECTLSGVYPVAITGGELEDTDAGRTVTVAIDFTNPSNPESAFVWDWMRLYVYQDGVELTLLDPEQDAFAKAAYGETVTCRSTYALRSDSPVLVELYGLREEAPSAGLVIPVG